MLIVSDYVMPASPLCSAIPLQGSDNVLGLSLLSRHNSGFGRWLILTFQKLSEPPKHWRDFFGGRNGTNMAFGFPFQPENVRKRLESNFHKFMVKW